MFHVYVVTAFEDSKVRDQAVFSCLEPASDRFDELRKEYGGENVSFSGRLVDVNIEESFVDSLPRIRAANAAKEQKRLWEQCEQFVADNKIEASKDLDEMPATAIKLLEHVCETVGYYDPEEIASDGSVRRKE